MSATSVLGAPQLPNPRFTAGEARAIAAEHWRVAGSAEEVGSSQDQNFRIRAEDGRQFVLKIANPLWRRAELELQNAAMHHVAGAEPGFAAPVPVATPRGDEIVHTRGHDVRLVTWVAGTPLAEAGRLAPASWRALGRLAALSGRALAGFEHPELDRPFQWDSRRAAEVVGALAAQAPEADRDLLARALAPLEALGGQASRLRVAPIHCDVTDYNTVGEPRAGGAMVPEGLLDFGDAVRTWRMCDPAHAAVSAIAHDRDDALGIALEVLEGYHGESPVEEAELDAYWPLVLARAAVCAAFSSRQASLSPDNVLVGRTLAHDWAVLRAVVAVAPVLGAAASRAACGADPSPAGSRLRRVLATAECAPVVEPPVAGAMTPVDLSVGSPLLAFGAWENPDGLAKAIAVPAGHVALGRWGEVRLTPAAPSFAPPATLHLGADVFAPPGTPVHAPLAGTVHALEPGSGILLACAAGNETAYVRIAGIAGIAAEVAVGEPVRAGQRLGAVAAASHGGLPAHVHVQVAADPDVPADGLPRHRAAWLALSPDPSPLLGQDARAPGPHPAAAVRESRAAAVAGAQRLYYETPPEMVRGWRHLLYDADGRPYVDAVNNVAVLGHSHPAVAEAAERQFRLLNTNSRFLYRAMGDYAERLAASLPAPLDRVFLVNSGSEAVDLALRLARSATGRRDVVALEGAYHGWTTATDELCTNPFDRPNWRDELPAHVHVVEQPDPYRGRHGDDGRAYAEAVREACRVAEPRGGVAAFLSEPLLGNQGGIVAAAGYLEAAYAHTRAAGGVCIADEIQVGYGRTGDTFWAFEAEGVVPDIVCVAKATGNGHPVGAVICRPEIAEAFERAAPFFSSTGGGPVSCEIGIAVLDAIRAEGLQENARRTGGRLKAGFERLAAAHPVIGAVHGRGLYLGVDLVRDRDTREPAPEAAAGICERMRDLGVIVQPTGDAFNVLKIKPPLCLDAAGADHLVAALERTLDEGW